MHSTIMRRGFDIPKSLAELLLGAWDINNRLERRLRDLFRPWAEVGFLPNEGETLYGEQVLKNVTTDRGTNTQLGLFTNVAPAETITEATLTEPTGTGYARITLTDASWSEGAAGVFSYAQQTFTAGAGGWTGSIQGYFISSNGTTPRIMAIEVDGNGPYTLNENDTYKITPQITVKDSGD